MTMQEDLRRAAALREELAQTEERMRRNSRAPTEGDLRAQREAQARVDDQYRAFGMVGAPGPMHGEETRAYRARLLEPLQKYVAAKDLAEFPITESSGHGFDVIERDIIREAQKEVDHPTALSIPAGKLVERVKTDISGRKITEFHGDPMSWMGTFMGPRRRVKYFFGPGGKPISGAAELAG